MSVSCSRSTSCSLSPSSRTSPTCGLSSPRKLSTPRQRQSGYNSARGSPSPGAAHTVVTVAALLAAESSLMSGAAATPSRPSLQARTNSSGSATLPRAAPPASPLTGGRIASPRTVGRPPRRRQASANARALASAASHWTPRARGVTSGSASDDDSSSEIGETAGDVSPDQAMISRAAVPPTEDAISASSAFSQATAGERTASDVRQSRRIAARASLAAMNDGVLERRFSTQVSMTPPARLAARVDESPFDAHATLAAQPATGLRKPPSILRFGDARSAGMPRSHACESLVPLGATSATSAEMGRGRSWEGGMRRTCPLPAPSALGSRAAINAAHQPKRSDAGTQAAARTGPPSPPAHSSHVRAKTETDSASASVAARRRRAPSFLAPLREPASHRAMELDSDTDADEAPPPSPSPMGDLAFPSALRAGSSEDEDAGVLQPGLRPNSSGPRRLQGSRSMSVGQQSVPQGLGLTLAFGMTSLPGPSRSSTASSFKSSGSASTTTIASSTSSAAVEASASSPYKTPFKRRAGGDATPVHFDRARSSSSGSSGSYDADSVPVGSRRASNGGSVSASAGQTSFGFAVNMAAPHSASETRSLDRDSKRRSTGSMQPPLTLTSRLFGAGAERADGPSSSTPATRAVRSSMPPARDASSVRRASIDSITSSTCGSPAGGAAQNEFDDSGVGFNTPAAKAHATLGLGPLGRQLGLGSARVGSSAKAPRFGGLDTSEYEASPAKAAAARREAGLHGQVAGSHPFSVRERSSLANEARLSDSSSSAASSPAPSRLGVRNVSVPEGLGSPARHIPDGLPPRDALSVGNFPLPDDHAVPYLTPQNFKNAKPLATAFLSTGLVSKQRGRAQGDIVPPLPPNFAALGAASAANASGVSASASGTALREIVAAANAKAATATPGTALMPDTPVKKMPVEASHAKPTLQPPPSVMRAPPVHLLGAPQQSAQPATRMRYSPALDSASSSSGASAAGGESPLLFDACDSPTLNLVSVSNSGSDLAGAAAAETGWPGFVDDSIRARRSRNLGGNTQLGQAFVPLPRTVSPPNGLRQDAPLERAPSFGSSLGTCGGSPLSDGPVSPSMQAQLSNARMPARAARARGTTFLAPGNAVPSAAAPSPAKPSARTGEPRSRSPGAPSSGSAFAASSLGPHNPFTRPPLLRSKTGSRPALILPGRANSFSATSDQATLRSLASPTFGPGAIPTTPTRNGGPIKWFEAAQLVTTPSPSSRRRTAEAHAAKRGSISGRLAKGSRLSHGPITVDALSQTGPSKTRGSLFLPPQAPKSPVISPFETRFTVQSVLGRGEFSEAVKVEDRSTGGVYAIKRMKRAFTGPRDRLRRLEEVDILRHLSSVETSPGVTGHSNVISLVDAWEEGGHLFVQTELCPLGTLSFFLEGYGNLVGQLDEPRLWKVLTELSLGLGHIHGHGILHLDLKPANVFITEIGTLKIGDFGLATRWPPVDPSVILKGAAIESTDAASAPDVVRPSNLGQRGRRGSKGPNVEREGDREYLAPEIMFEAHYSQAADIFSLGLIMLEAAGNVVLPDNGEAWQKLRNDDLSDVDLSNFSVSLVRLIKTMMSKAPHCRPSIQSILGHPVVKAVQARMAEGLMASELDQLPEFDLAAADLSCTSAPEVDDEGDADMANAGAGTGPSSEDMARSGSASSSSSAYSSGDESRVLDVRGALIQEPEDFLLHVLSADPDPDARERCHEEPSPWAFDIAAVDMTPIKVLSGNSHFSGGVGLGIDANSPFAIHFTCSPGHGAGAEPHASFAASPLRKQHDCFSSGGAADAGAMDLDDDDVFQEP